MSMKSADKPHRPFRGKIISLTIIAIGVAVGLYVERRISIRPSTDDATIDADVVHVASAVGGTLCLIAWLSSRPRLIWGSP